jgi:hypothetical protein
MDVLIKPIVPMPCSKLSSSSKDKMNVLDDSRASSSIEVYLGSKILKGTEQKGNNTAPETNITGD